MSRGKRHRPLRTGVKRRWRERNAEAVVRFRYFFSDFIPTCIKLSTLFADPSTIMLQCELVQGKVMVLEEVEQELREAGMDMQHKEKLTLFKWSKNAPQSQKRLQADHMGRRGKGGTQDGVEVGQENVNRLQTEGLKHDRGHLSREGQVLRDHLADVFSMAALGPGTSVNQNGLGFQVEMIIVVHNECHFYSNVLDYLNNFIIFTISQDNYLRPPPPLIEKCFLDDVSDILLPCSCYQTTMRSGRECASRQCLPTGNKGREEREGTGSPI